MKKMQCKIKSPPSQKSPRDDAIAEDRQPLRQEGIAEDELQFRKSEREVIVDEKQQLKQAEKEAKAVFLPEERTPRRPWQERVAKLLKIKHEWVRLMLAEFLGTFVLVSIGVGSVAQAVLGGTFHDGNIVTIVFGWGLAVTMGVYVCGGVSGGHINPAVTTAMVLLGRLPVRKMPFYLIGQYVGAILASFAVWVVYHDSLGHYLVLNVTENTAKAAGIWATYSKDHVSLVEGFADQVFSTMLLVLLVMAITDERNMGTPKGLVPIAIGLGVVAILSGYAHNCGGALNPARDLAPRIFTAMAGWGKLPFTHRDYFFWVPVIAPHIGAVIGALLYNICVGLHWPEPDAHPFYGNGKA